MGIPKIFGWMPTGVGQKGKEALGAASNTIGDMFSSVGQMVNNGYGTLFSGDITNRVKRINNLKSGISINTSRAEQTARDISIYKKMGNISAAEGLYERQAGINSALQKQRGLLEEEQNAMDGILAGEQFLLNHQKAVGGAVIGAGALGATGLGVAAYNAYND